MDYKKNNDIEHIADNDKPDYDITIEDTVETKSDRVLKKTLEWLFCFVLSVGVALAIKYYIVTLRIVDQTSMYPTLDTNQRLIVNRWSRTAKRDIERGSIITFYAPSVMRITEASSIKNPVAIYDNDRTFSTWDSFKYYILEINKVSYVKRVIGISGDKIKIADGKVYLNDELLNEPYLASDVTTPSMDGIFTNITVPDGYVFVMGDNRGRSTDSRCFGCIPLDKVEGDASFRFWPLDLFGKV